MTKISLLEMGKTKKRSVREAIISVLSSEYPLSVKKIFNGVRKEYGLGVTYQAVFKFVKEMVEDGVIEKNGMEYQLNMVWIKDLESELNVIKNKYNVGKSESSDSLQDRVNAFVSTLGPKIKEFIGKDDAAIVAVSGGGKFFAMSLLKYLLRENIKVNYLEINWLSKIDNDSLIFKKSEVENKKLVLVDSEIYSGTTLKTIMENLNKNRNRLNILDIKFAADKDVPGLADFSREH